MTSPTVRIEILRDTQSTLANGTFISSLTAKQPLAETLTAPRRRLRSRSPPNLLPGDGFASHLR